MKIRAAEEWLNKVQRGAMNIFTSHIREKDLPMAVNEIPTPIKRARTGEATITSPDLGKWRKGMDEG